MAIDEVSQQYTTFTTANGNYMWARAPMGPKNCVALYQKAMATEVFPDMINQIMQLYLDDFETDAPSFKEMLLRLRKILTRLREFNITLNPKKCKFGLSEVEFVGHLVTRYGLNFTQEKKEEVLNFVLPETKGKLKTFIGLTGYFQRHIKGYVNYTHLLNQMLTGYEKRLAGEKLMWTEETTKAFHELQNAVANCQTLHFRDPQAPVRVYTDASDYGIGAYLCQVVQDQEDPVAFISKTLSIQEKKWSVYDKEAFAIFYALRKWAHYLQDIKFTLFTDHKNLTYINTEPSPKVTRWKVAIQEFDFDIAYIPGPDNIVADGFSRFCPESIADEPGLETASIAMLMSSITEQDRVIDTKLFQGASRNDITSETFVIDPSYEWEAKSYLAERVNMINSLRSTTQQRESEEEGQIQINLFQAEEKLPHNIYKIISKCHSAKAGHWGVTETWTKVEELLQKDPSYKDLIWPTIRKDVRTFVRQCACCQLNQTKKYQIDMKKYTTSKFGIFKNLSIDAIYMPESESLYKYILVIIDSGSRYVQLYPIRNLSAASAAECLIEHMNTFGIPDQLCTDNSTQFEGVFREMLEYLRVYNYKIHPYSHQENSIVERANKEVLRHVRNFIFDHRVINEWHKFISDVERIINSHIHKSTGIAPVDMVFAGQVNLNEGRLFPHRESPPEMPLSEYMQQLTEYQKILLDIAEKNQKQTDMFHYSKEKQNAVATPFVVRGVFIGQPDSRQCVD